MNLVIVESPAKAKTIKGFLGKDYIVESSVGHIRDMAKKNMGIDIENQFQPSYEISPDKKKIVSKLKKLAKAADTIYLATDEDREGESIAWHLAQALNLPANTPRIAFHEITKTAIVHAIESPRIVDQPLVDAQQARRVIDRLVGFEISPVLWRKISGAKSAGRVQSPVVRLVVEKERTIMDFASSSAYKVKANLTTNQGELLEVKLKQSFANKVDAQAFANDLLSAKLSVVNIEKKPSKRTPPPPFMTSTLQQDASSKLGFSVKKTMTIAQNLYREGHISYMRTDSLNLSKFAIDAATQVITSTYGDKYLQVRHYKTKSSGAQEAHEAIRPTDMAKANITGLDEQTAKLYRLIRNRALGSQMSPALLDKTQIQIKASNRDELFVADGEVLIFPGFLALYNIDNEQDKLLPQVAVNESLTLVSMSAKQTFAKPPARYTEASLVKKIEEMGIGRPSTFASMISTVQDRGYVLKDTLVGKKRECGLIEIKDNTVHIGRQIEMAGADQNKLFPSSVAYILTDFLVKYFDNIVDYQFTANLEANFDKIADQKAIWHKVVEDFYTPFHGKIEVAADIPREEINNARLVGEHPKSGKPITVRLGRYGPFAQIGEKEDEEEPTFASLKKEQHLDTITIEEILELFKMPRVVGEMTDGTVVKANYGRFGPYVQYGKKYVSLKAHNPEKVSLETALELIAAKEAFDATRVIQTFGKSAIEVLNGRFGPYIWNGKKRGKGQQNITIKQIFGNKDPASLSLKECEDAISGKLKPKAKPKTKPKTATKNKTVKKIY